MDMQLRDGPDGSVYLIEVDWPDSAYQRIAAQYSAILNTHVTVLSPGDPTATGYNGFRVKTAGAFHADVAMLVNWRLALVPVGVQRPVPKRYWCFAGRDGLSLALAMGNAALWNGADDWAPEGFSRAWNTIY